MVNKKGFTLVELIGVIALLAVVALITIPIMTNSIKKSKEKTYIAQVKNIISSAKKWVVANGPKSDKEFNITLSELLNDKIIENDLVIDPRDDTNMVDNGACVFVNYNDSNKTYSYLFSNNCKK